jgi:putative alpha-1,2-mannosidase
MGFYQVEPAGGKYIFGSPVVDKAVIKVKDGKTFTITATNNSAENKYIQKVMLNGQPYPHYYIQFKDIEQGGTLEFVMGNTHE